MDNIYFPAITNFSPALRTGAATALRPLIEIDWSTNIQETQFSDGPTRAKLIQLIQTNLGTLISTEFVSYSPGNKRVAIRPTQDLDRGARFKVVVADGVLSTDGRSSRNKFQWEFETSLPALGTPNLLQPANSSLQVNFPELAWSTVTSTGLVNYQVELDNNWDFGSPIFVGNTIGSSITPIGSFPSENTYYWRVRAYTSTVTGAWTAVGSFYFGSVQVAHPTSDQTWTTAEIFGLSRTIAPNGLTNLKAHPVLAFTFTSPPAANFVDFITTTEEHQVPRNDQPDTYNVNTVPGSWSLVGNTLTFTPLENIKTNRRYKIAFSDLLTNTASQKLNSPLEYYWTGPYDPFYITPRLIRASFLSAEQNIPDDVISYWIHRASLEAKARYYGYLHVPPGYTFMGEFLTESSVRDTSNLRTFGALKWVEAATTYMMLKAILHENLRNVGRSRRIGDYSESLTRDFLEAMKLAMEKAKEDLDVWDNFLVTSDVPRSAIRSSDWSPLVHDFDPSIANIEGTRDNGWWIR